ncbi:MAG: hypothetical protein ACOYBQ_10215 [Fluviibacter sp.]
MAIQILPEKDPAPIPFDRITPDDMALIQQCAARAVWWMRDFKARHKREDLLDPEPMLIAMDIAAVHLVRPLKLWQWLASNDLDFVGDLVAITKNIDRTCGAFPNGVRLEFQQAQ